MAYRGIEVTIPLGDHGLLTDAAPTDIPPSALIFATNIALFNGVVQKAPGSLKYNSTPLSAGIVALKDWWPDTVKQRLVALTSDGKVYKDTGAGSFMGQTPIATGLGTLTANCVMVEGGIETAGRSKKLFIFTEGQNQLKVINSDTDIVSNITNPAADWTVGNYPKFGIVHRNRLWAFAGQRSYASDSGNHENFTTNFLTDAIYPGEGGEIRSAFVYKGRLFAFKDGGFVYYLDDADPDSDNWLWRKIASNFGLAAPNAIVEVLNDMLGGNTTGTITSYAATDALGDISSADILQQAQMENFLRASTSKNGVPYQHLCYYPEKKLLFATYRSGYYTYNDMLIVVDVNRQAQPRITYWIKGSPQCMTLRKDVNDIPRPIYGDKDGYVHIMDYEDRLEGSASYTGAFQLPHWDFRFVDPKFAETTKHFDHLSVSYVPEGDWNLNCDYYIDGKYVETITFPMDQLDDSQLDVLLLDTNPLAQMNTETFTRRLKGTGKTLSLKFYNAGSNQSFQVASVTVGFRPGSQNAQKAI